MLTDLPRELFEAVYDRLHVHDRMRLNAAMPRDRRVTRGARIDERLALACLATKRRRRSAPLKAFLLDNLAEPTVRSMLEEDATLAEDLRATAREREIRDAKVASDIPRDATKDELEVLVLDMIRNGTPERLEAFAPVARQVLEVRHGSKCDALFSALNYQNDDMAAHLVSRGRELYGIDVDAMVRFVTEGYGRSLMTSRRTRESILRVVPLTAEQRREVIHSMMDDLDVDAYIRQQGKAG